MNIITHIADYTDRAHQKETRFQDCVNGEQRQTCGGAVWDIFRREDVPKLEAYIREHWREFRNHENMAQVQAVSSSGRLRLTVSVLSGGSQGSVA
ncbi:hypothetical protein R1flu_002989 [Riccia fluitans]|uniref:Uncharacterized protein n=1 Tax=Riccia fluitans TaxID=41844 RepID=A0ABD1Y7P7_9MARC